MIQFVKNTIASVDYWRKNIEPYLSSRININHLTYKKGVSQMQNLRHPLLGSADLGDSKARIK